jgi:erythritol transport system permease protein
MSATEITMASPAPPRRSSPLLVLLSLRTLIALFVVLAFFSATAPNFLDLGTLVLLAKHVSINALLAIGMTFVVLTGGIDLSVGSIVGLAGMIAGGLIDRGVPLHIWHITLFPDVPIVIALTLLVGVLVGTINGLLVTWLSVAPFIATLGTLYIARGSAVLVSNGETFPNLVGRPQFHNTGFPVLGAGTVLGIPVSVILLVVVGAIAAYVAARTPFGRRIYAVGGNERAALLSGVPVDRVKLAVYMISGGCAALAGLIVASELVASHPASGETFELNAIAATVLGGTSLVGGRGTIWGTIVGAFVIGILADGLVMLGVSSFWQMVIKGLVIIAAVVLDQLQRRTQRRMAIQTQTA